MQDPSNSLHHQDQRATLQLTLATSDTGPRTHTLILSLGSQNIEGSSQTTINAVFP